MKFASKEKFEVSSLHSISQTGIFQKKRDKSNRNVEQKILTWQLRKRELV